MTTGTENESSQEGANGDTGGSDAGNETGNNENQSLLDGAESTVEGAGTGEPESGATVDWQLTPDIAGTGERPEWFDSKYKTVEEQAKAYPELAKRFGGFTGAPEGDYAVTVPEGMPEGTEVVDNDPMLKGFAEMAKESNMSQEMFTQMTHWYMTNDYNNIQAHKESELAALGTNATERIKTLVDWGKANLDAEGYEQMQAMATTAGSVGVLEQLISGMKASTVVPSEAVVDPKTTREELDAMVADPRYQTDPVYRKKVQAEFNRVIGTKPAHQVVG